MSNIAIQFEHVSKMYQLGVVGTGTISNDLKRWWQMSVLGKEDPFLRIGQTNDRTTKGSSEFVYALKDIDFKVEQGDVVGIIGKNGAGKSTLLKLLSRITAPSSGSIKAKGRIASLLEVGTGFHPELTGRENIYLNGSIMGMRKHEIDRKLDAIVDFAGVERYLDTPTKRYSSGMQVRLGFAVAAFLEPEILVVDEVLAVGDAEFQKKAIGKMQDVSQGEGRTVLFVSHNMNSVRALCKHGVVLKNGMVEMDGTADECVDYYMDTKIQNLVGHSIIGDKHRMEGFVSGVCDVEILETRLVNPVDGVATDGPLVVEIIAQRNTNKYESCQFSVLISNSSDIRVANYITELLPIPKNRDRFLVRIVMENHGLPKGQYSIQVTAGLKDFSKGNFNFDIVRDVLSFEVKYLHEKTKTEYLSWGKDWALTLHGQESTKAELLSI